jgi:GMP synthase (glutamine-hydrolysing)
MSLFLRMPEHELTGMLLDLELDKPDPERHRELREVLTSRVGRSVPAIAYIKVSLVYCHFSDFTLESLKSSGADFLVLSPQGTPWSVYLENAASEFRRSQEVLRQAVLDLNVPVIAICGGHQFLALTFGGKVDYIDPSLSGGPRQKYPRDAISERGLVKLEILRDDPIFQGVATCPGTFTAVESHYEEVKNIPAPFVNLAKSKLSEIQFVRLPGRIVYGTAFHPERSGNSDPGTEAVTDGRLILANFLRMVSGDRSRSGPHTVRNVRN